MTPPKGAYLRFIHIENQFRRKNVLVAEQGKEVIVLAHAKPGDYLTLANPEWRICETATSFPILQTGIHFSRALDSIGQSIHINDQHNMSRTSVSFREYI